VRVSLRVEGDESAVVSARLRIHCGIKLVVAEISF
jgi:hypothetical protein